MIRIAITLVGFICRTRNTNSKNVSAPTVIAALFTIVKMWKQPECPSADMWIKEL